VSRGVERHFKTTVTENSTTTAREATVATVAAVAAGQDTPAIADERWEARARDEEQRGVVAKHNPTRCEARREEGVCINQSFPLPLQFRWHVPCGLGASAARARARRPREAGGQGEQMKDGIGGEVRGGRGRTEPNGPVGCSTTIHTSFTLSNPLLVYSTFPTRRQSHATLDLVT
jgi:hypothetical protein